MRAIVPISRLAVWSACLVLLAGCGTLIADYSEQAYQNATTLKAETQAMMSKASEAYPQHSTSVEALSTRIDAAYEFAKGTNHNQLSARQWELLKDPSRNLYGGFVARWKARGTVNAVVIRESKKQVAETFDYIICLEVNKQSKKACSSLEPAAPAAVQAETEAQP